MKDDSDDDDDFEDSGNTEEVKMNVGSGGGSELEFNDSYS